MLMMQETVILTWLDAVQAWIGNWMLKLNPYKTEFILLGKSSARDELSSFSQSHILRKGVTPMDQVKNLGVHFHSDVSFDTHIRPVCKDFCRIHNHLNKENVVLVVNALVSSRLYYCKSLFYDISKSNLGKLHHVQNAMCHIFCRLGRQAHVTPQMHELPWLPICGLLIRFYYPFKQP